MPGPWGPQGTSFRVGAVEARPSGGLRGSRVGDLAGGGGQRVAGGGPLLEGSSG